MHTFSNHAFVISTRIIGLSLTALLLFIQQRPIDWWSVWVALMMGTIMLMMMVQPVMRIAVRQPWILGVDVAIAAMVVVATEPWNSPFFVYACAVLALPAVVSGWRGGLLAGLLCAGVVFILVPILDVSFGTELPHIWLRWCVVAVGPALVGASMPHVLSRIRAAGYAKTVIPPSTDVPSPFAPLRSWDAAGIGGWWAERMSRQSVDSDVAVSTRVETLRVVLYEPIDDASMLLDVVNSYAERFEQHALVATRVVVLGRPSPHDELCTPVIRRVLIESLLNVAQHANADSVVIMLRYDKNTLTMLINDDGKGLPDTGIQRAGLHSLQSLMYRASELGGRLEVFNHSPAGVAVRLMVPLVPAT